MQAGNHKKLDVLSCDTKTLRSTLRRTAFMRLTLPGHSPSRAGDSSAVKHLPSTHEALGSAACSEEKAFKANAGRHFLRNDQFLRMGYLNVKFKK